MIPGLYTGASGMKAQLDRMDALSNNLSNVDVTGYKRDVSVSKAFQRCCYGALTITACTSFPSGALICPRWLGLSVPELSTTNLTPFLNRASCNSLTIPLI